MSKSWKTTRITEPAGESCEPPSTTDAPSDPASVTGGAVVELPDEQATRHIASEIETGIWFIGSLRDDARNAIGAPSSSHSVWAAGSWKGSFPVTVL
jgi:hypothetical protein